MYLVSFQRSFITLSGIAVLQLEQYTENKEKLANWMLFGQLDTSTKFIGLHLVRKFNQGFFQGGEEQGGGHLPTLGHGLSPLPGHGLPSLGHGLPPLQIILPPPPPPKREASQGL